MAKILYKLTKGLLYGSVIGLYFSMSIYLLAQAVLSVGISIGLAPAQLASIIFAACVVGGIGMEYSSWMDEQEEKK